MYTSGLICLPCSSNCTTCSSNAITCDTCTSHAGHSVSENFTCVICGPGFFLDNLSVCRSCGVACGTCSGVAANCTSCKTTEEFLAPTTGQDHTCQACDISCATCTNATSCLTCKYASEYRNIPDDYLCMSLQS